MSRIALEPGARESAPLYLGEERIEHARLHRKRSIPALCPECGGKARMEADGYGVCRQCGVEFGE